MSVFLRAAKAWIDDDAFSHSAAVAFYTLFSLAPVTLIVGGIVGFFFGHDVAAHQISTQLGQLVGKDSAGLIERTVNKSALAGGWWSISVGLVLLIAGATTVFGQLQKSLNHIWSVTARPRRSWTAMIVEQLISFAMVLVIGFLLVVSLIVTTILSAVLDSLNNSFAAGVLLTADVLIGLLIITTLFAFLFKMMPEVIVGWREVWLGAVVTAALFTIGRYAIAFYLQHSTVATNYGAAGSLVALLLWIYYSCAILFYGAEFVRMLHGKKVVPKPSAALVRKRIVM